MVRSARVDGCVRGCRRIEQRGGGGIRIGVADIVGNVRDDPRVQNHSHEAPVFQQRAGRAGGSLLIESKLVIGRAQAFGCGA